jgi:hypothetical protein
MAERGPPWDAAAMTKAARLLLCLALAVTATASTLQTWLPGGQPKRKVRLADAAPELTLPVAAACATTQPA